MPWFIYPFSISVNWPGVNAVVTGKCNPRSARRTVRPTWKLPTSALQLDARQEVPACSPLRPTRNRRWQAFHRARRDHVRLFLPRQLPRQREGRRRRNVLGRMLKVVPRRKRHACHPRLAARRGRQDPGQPKQNPRCSPRRIHVSYSPHTAGELELQTLPHGPSVLLAPSTESRDRYVQYYRNARWWNLLDLPVEARRIGRGDRRRSTVQGKTAATRWLRKGARPVRRRAWPIPHGQPARRRRP